MNTMQEYASDYLKEHCRTGKVTHVTDYSFTFEKNPTKEGKVESYVVYMSYFWS